MNRNNKIKIKTAIGRVLITLSVILAILLFSVFGAVYILEKGPSPVLSSAFCQSLYETSALRWVAGIFLNEEELESRLSAGLVQEAATEMKPELIHAPEDNGASEEIDNVTLVDISHGTCKGKLLIVKDPMTVVLGISGDFGEEPGLQLTDMAAKYNAVAGINAGGFVDNGGRGDGGTPLGLVICDGQIIWGEEDSRYNVVGLDGSGILHVERETAAEAIEKGVVWGVSFVTHDGQASALVINGEVQTSNLRRGINPRTAIGQCADGTILLLVLDGRSFDTLGATVENVCDIMLEYGAVNVGNLDGGSSSVMVKDGEILNRCASVTGPRRIPTAFLVLGKENDNG